jgi:hypothetical protein
MTWLPILGGSDAGISAALFQGMRVDDLRGLDLSYTPPISSLLNPVLMSVQSWMQAATACERG